MVRILDERSKQVTKSMQEAEEREQKAAEAQAEYEQTLADIDTMRTHARLLQLAASAPAPEQLGALLERDPDNRAAALQRIGLAITGDDYQAAFDTLMKQLKTAAPEEREFLNKVMLALFNLLGEDTELTNRFRKLYLDQL